MGCLMMVEDGGLLPIKLFMTMVVTFPLWFGALMIDAQLASNIFQEHL